MKLLIKPVLPVVAKLQGTHPVEGLKYHNSARRYWYNGAETFVRIETPEDHAKLLEQFDEDIEYCNADAPLAWTDFYYNPNSLGENFTSFETKKPKVLFIGNQFSDALADAFSKGMLETWGFGMDPVGWDHWTPGPESDEDVLDAKERFRSFPFGDIVINSEEKVAGCFDIVSLNLCSFPLSSIHRDFIDLAEEHLRPGGVIIISAKFFHLRALTRVLCSRFESIHLDKKHRYGWQNDGNFDFGSDDIATMYGVKKSSRSRDETTVSIMTEALSISESTETGQRIDPKVCLWPVYETYPPPEVVVQKSWKEYDDSIFEEQEEVECVLNQHETKLDPQEVRKELGEDAVKATFGIGTSFWTIFVTMKGHAVPRLRAFASSIGADVRAKGEKSTNCSETYTEPRNTSLVNDYNPVIFTKTLNSLYMSQFCSTSPLSLHANLVQKKVEEDRIMMPVPPKITNLTKLIQHLKGVVQGPDGNWILTRGLVETVEHSYTTETDEETTTITSTKKRVKQFAIILSGLDKGAVIEVEA